MCLRGPGLAYAQTLRARYFLCSLSYMSDCLAVCPSHGSLAPFLVKPSVIRETCQNRQNPLSTEGTVGCARLQTRFLLVTGGWPWRLSIYRLCAECLTDTDAAKHNHEQTTQTRAVVYFQGIQASNMRRRITSISRSWFQVPEIKDGKTR